MRNYQNDERLGHLLRPVGATNFFADYWGKYPVKLKTGASFDNLIQAKDIDSILRYGDVNIRLVKQIDGKTNNRDVPILANSPDLYGVYKAWVEGYSIAIDDVRTWPSIAEYCQHLEALTHYRTSSTIFLTPPGCQCFPPHYDGHEALVVQIEGSKDWTVWPREKIGPRLVGAAIDHPESLSDPVIETTLDPGDVLYMPRGYPHQAKATKGRSLHLTIQFFPPTYRNFREHLLKVAEHLKVPLPVSLPMDFAESDRRPELNGPLPVGFLDIENLGNDLLEWIEPGILELLVKHTKGVLRHEVSVLGQPVSAGYFGFEHHIADITATTLFRKRNMSLCTTGGTSEQAWIKFHQLTATAKPGMLPVFRFIADTDCFQLADLPGSMPESDIRQAIAQLVRIGLLAIAEAP